MTKEFIDSIVKQLKEYVDAKLRGWGLSDEEKSLVAFEQKHMPYTQYSGNQSIDHVLFRKFLRLFDPKVIEQEAIDYLKEHIDESSDAVLSVFQRKKDDKLQTENKTVIGAVNELLAENTNLKQENEELRKELDKVRKIANAAL